MTHHIQHHLHQRKRIHKLDQPYPHSSKNVRLLDNICIVFSLIMPATAIPQIIKIFYYQDATSLSLLMWLFYCIGVIPFLLYGIVHKVKSLIILNSFWLIMQLIIIWGIVLYG